MGLKAEIWASRLRYGLGGWGEGGAEEKREEKEEEEKIPHVCESIGHRPPRGRCPKTVSLCYISSPVAVALSFNIKTLTDFKTGLG